MRVVTVYAALRGHLIGDGDPKDRFAAMHFFSRKNFVRIFAEERPSLLLKVIHLTVFTIWKRKGAVER